MYCTARNHSNAARAATTLKAAVAFIAAVALMAVVGACSGSNSNASNSSNASSSNASKPSSPAQPASTADASDGKENKATTMTKTMQPATETTFKRGVALTPSDKLTAYLTSLKTIDGKALRVRLPVVITMDPTGFGIDGATVGSLAVQLNDGALGISLVDRLRTACPNASKCAIWLEGLWQPPTGFDVRKVHKAIADADLAAADYCEVQDL